MNFAVTEGTYSRDNCEPSLCTLADGRSGWVAWAAYGRRGSRAFVRRFDGEVPGSIVPLSSSDTMQTNPVCVPNGRGAWFVWLERWGRSYSVWSCEHDGEAFKKGEELCVLPESARPWDLQALRDGSDALWVNWAQSVRGRSSVEALRVVRGREPTRIFVEGRSAFSYRPRMVAWGDGVYLVWDGYADGVYDVYGCPVSQAGPSEVVRISRDASWENKSAICRDREGGLWAVWVRWQDVMYRGSAMQQKYSLRGARYDGRAWVPLSGADGGPDLAPLHYGLLTDFPRPPQLGHMGRRLHPILKGAEDGGVWLFYEVKADQEQGTLTSRGRLFAHRCAEGRWSEPRNLAEGGVYYELPHNGVVGVEVPLLSRDIDTDELHLRTVRLSEDLPVVPESCRRVDLTEWKEIRLPFRERREEDRSRNELPGEAQGRYRLFWADLHCHSAVSHEMEGAPDELGHFARDKAQIDALAVSDNDTFWSRFSRQNVRFLTDYEWDTIRGNALVLNEPGRFAMFPGYEMTVTDQHDSGRDHRSVISDDDEMEMDLLHLKYAEAYRKGERDTQKETLECISWLKKKGYLALPHPHNGKWNLYDTEVEWGVDVCAAWMLNIDLYDIYFHYLNAGHRFAFTGSGDGHHRNPGYSGALTGIWAERLDRASLLSAVKSRRCFATAGQRITMEFTINGQMMGSSLAVKEDPILKWRVAGEEGQPYILRIHRDGRLMHDVRFTGQTEGELKEFMLRRYRPGRHYYHLEVASPHPIPQYPANVAHAMGEKGWTTPIWVETTG
ncbi:MAG: DUF3604 domain-containing protein [Candidatus Latescibacteria bacterium]|nr:DUF3604 domain-containing protein [Candidatus Latescibacterota bacterium]